MRVQIKLAYAILSEIKISQSRSLLWPHTWNSVTSSLCIPFVSPIEILTYLTVNGSVVYAIFQYSKCTFQSSITVLWGRTIFYKCLHSCYFACVHFHASVCACCACIPHDWGFQSLSLVMLKKTPAAKLSEEKAVPCICFFVIFGDIFTVLVYCI